MIKGCVNLTHINLDSRVLAKTHLVNELHPLVELRCLDDLVGEPARLEHPHGLVVKVNGPG